MKVLLLVVVSLCIFGAKPGSANDVVINNNTSDVVTEVQFLHYAVSLGSKNITVDVVMNTTVIHNELKFESKSDFVKVKTTPYPYNISIVDSKTQLTIYHIALAFPTDRSSKSSILIYTDRVTQDSDSLSSMHWINDDSKSEGGNDNEQQTLAASGSYYTILQSSSYSKQTFKNLGTDIAKVRLVNAITNQSTVEVWGVTDNCYDCFYLPLAFVGRLADTSIFIDTNFLFHFELRESGNSSFNFSALLAHYTVQDLVDYYQTSNYTSFLNFHTSLDEYGIYTFILYNHKYPTFHVGSELGGIEGIAYDKVTYDGGVDSYEPIYIAIVIYFGLFLLYLMFLLGSCAFGKYCKSFKTPTREEQQQSGVPVQASKKRRVESLDCVRGLSIVIMIFVNYGGGSYWFFNHSVWDGLTLADLVFPWFIWIMGTSMALSFKSIEAKKTPKYQIFFKIVKRSIILFGLGLFF